MKKKTLFLILVLMIVFAVLKMSDKEQNVQQKIRAAATIYPVYDIAANIAGGRAQVICIVKPGASPHTFSLTPSEVKRFQGVKAVFAVGHGIDEWVSDFAANSGNVKIYTVDGGIKLKKLRFEHKYNDHRRHHEIKNSIDPHYWLSPENAAVIAENICRVFVKLDEENSSCYRKNLKVFLNKMRNLKMKSQKMLDKLKKNEIIVMHESWNYFADAFNLKVIGVFASSPGKEPTPAQMKELYRTAEEREVNAVFTEPQLSPSSVKPFIEDLGLELYVLDPLGGVNGRKTYEELILYNCRTIREALGEKSN